MLKNFPLFLSQLKESNQTLDCLCDFEKIQSKIEEVKLNLCLLNSLIGSQNLLKDIQRIWSKDPSSFQSLALLIAVRNPEKTIIDIGLQKCANMQTMFSSPEHVFQFLNDTGLGDLLKQRGVNNLIDYALGVETGLDSNARKNRNGNIMEQTVAKLFKQNNISFIQTVYSSDYTDLSRALGSDNKCFDFLISAKDNIYLIETNFYNTCGSKLNEIARSYTELASKIDKLKNFKFVWITDGIDWLYAKKQLQEAYMKIPHVYNLTTIGEFIKELNETKY